MVVYIVCIVMNILDIISGLVVAIKHKNIVSSKLRDGIFKKFGFLVIYILCYIVDKYGLLFGIALPISLSTLSCTYIFFTETISIYENAKKLNKKVEGIKIDEKIKGGKE